MSIKIEYAEKYIAFLDVLGFSNIVFSKDKEAIEKYYNLTEEGFTYFNKNRKEIEIIQISDSIILIANNDSFNLICDTVRTLQAVLASKGIWIRGAITSGEIYYNKEKSIIVGSGYIKAYNLESEAIFPRVIIDPNILTKLGLTLMEFYKKYNNQKQPHWKLFHEYAGQVRNTSDDAIFICSANRNIIMDLINQAQTLESIYLNIRKNLYSEQKHYSKYLWLKKYYLDSLIEMRTIFKDIKPDMTMKLETYIKKFSEL